MPVTTLVENPVLESFVTEPLLLKPSVGSTPPLASTVGQRASIDDEQIDAWREHAEAVVRGAEAAAASVPSPTTFIRLAQARYIAGDEPGAAESALRAMTTATHWLAEGKVTAESISLVLGSGADLLARLGNGTEAIAVLEHLGPPPALELTYASLLVDAGRSEEALAALTSDTDAQADALRGYIYAVSGSAQTADRKSVV